MVNGTANGMVTRPVRRMTQGELDNFLEGAADILRGNVDHSEFRGYVFALLFYKRINDVYEENVRLYARKLGGEEASARDPKMHEFVVPNDCQWEKVAHTTETKLGTALNNAMLAIERANAPKFDGILFNPSVDFNAQETIPRAKLISLINHFGTRNFDRASVSDDLFGNAYEYLIRTFASKAGKSSGEFYTPKEVAFLMSEIVEPQPGHHICDWAAGSGGLLLQCRRYVERHYGQRQADRVFFYLQESNLSTYNISRINMILHGVKTARHTRQDSLRQPQFVEGQSKRLRQFDRIVMNPPFSLKDWGYADFAGGDPYGRFGAAMPPADNGDYAWMLHVVKSLKPTGKAIVVMSQGILFRDQPEQTEEEDGRNHKAGPEYVIREGFIKSDFIECVIVLPSKIFYGNAVPACLVVLDKHKPADRKDKILMIWASRDYENTNPQNIIRRSDCMRILVPWRAFGDLTKCREVIPQLEAELIAEIEHERAAALKELHDAYDPLLAPLPVLRAEQTALEAFFTPGGLNTSTSVESTADKPRASSARPTPEERTKLRVERKAKTERLKLVRRQIKELGRLEEEANEKIAAVNQHADREITLARETAADLLRICSDPGEARRYFAITERPEIEENEFNLNIPRYVDTFEPEEQILVEDALAKLKETATQAEAKRNALLALIAANTGH